MSNWKGTAEGQIDITPKTSTLNQMKVWDHVDVTYNIVFQNVYTHKD